MQQPIYLSGPMTGIAEFNYPAFNAAAQVLRGLGYEVFNPAEQDQKPSWEDYMRHDIKAMMGCRTLVVLDGAHESRGAMIEMQLAQTLGIRIVPFGKIKMEKVA